MPFSVPEKFDLPIIIAIINRDLVLDLGQESMQYLESSVHHLPNLIQLLRLASFPLCMYDILLVHPPYALLVSSSNLNASILKSIV
jgi:hypothetical protein